MQQADFRSYCQSGGSWRHQHSFLRSSSEWGPTTVLRNLAQGCNLTRHEVVEVEMGNAG